MIAFRVGQKVLCVDGSAHWGGHGDEMLPVEGNIYTIRELVDCHEEGVGVRLVEVLNQPRHYNIGFMEGCLLPERFRPLVTTNIGVFKAMLTRPRQPVDAR
jgi:hypothetical protein